MNFNIPALPVACCSYNWAEHLVVALRTRLQRAVRRTNYLANYSRMPEVELLDLQERAKLSKSFSQPAFTPEACASWKPDSILQNLGLAY